MATSILVVDPLLVWTKAVNRLLHHHFNLTLADLPDMNTRDAFDSGQTPEDFFQSDVRELLIEEFGSKIEEHWPAGDSEPDVVGFFEK